MPCQVPSTSRPPASGIVSETAVSAVRTCAGMSSGPSSWWRNSGSPSGTRRAKKRARSAGTAWAAFSWISRLAEVWRTNSVSRPVSKPDCATHDETARVKSTRPRPRVSTTRVVAACLIIRAGQRTPCPSRSALLRRARPADLQRLARLDRLRGGRRQRGVGEAGGGGVRRGGVALGGGRRGVVLDHARVGREDAHELAVALRVAGDDLALVQEVGLAAEVADQAA